MRKKKTPPAAGRPAPWGPDPDRIKQTFEIDTPAGKVTVERTDITPYEKSPPSKKRRSSAG